MLDSIKHSVAMAARKTVLAMISAMLFITGTAFLTVSAWLAISAIKGAVFAASVLGLGYLGAAVVLFAVLASKADTRTRHDTGSVPPPSPMGGVANAFLQGVAAGATARRN